MKKIIHIIYIISLLVLGHESCFGYSSLDLDEDEFCYHRALCDGTPLIQSVISNDKKGARDLILAGADVNAVVVKYGAQMTALTFAIEKNNIEIVKDLVLAGADINYILDSRGGSYNALCVAIIERNIDIIKFLISQGANVDFTEPNGCTLIGIKELFEELIKDSLN